MFMCKFWSIYQLKRNWLNINVKMNWYFKPSMLLRQCSCSMRSQSHTSKQDYVMLQIRFSSCIVNVELVYFILYFYENTNDNNKPWRLKWASLIAWCLFICRPIFLYICHIFIGPYGSLIWVCVRRRESCVVRRPSCAVRRPLSSSFQELLDQYFRNLVCSISRERAQEIVNLMTPIPRIDSFGVKFL